MTDGPLDLSALKAAVDHTTEDRVVGGAMRQIAALRTRRPDILTSLSLWLRPALVAAAAVICVSGGLILASGEWQPSTLPTIAESVGIPPAIERWMAGSAMETDALLDEMRGRDDH